MDSAQQKGLLAVLKGCWGSETLRHLGVSCTSARVWVGTPTFQVILRCNAAVQFFDRLQKQNNENSYMLTMQLGPRSNDAVQPISLLPWMVWHNCISTNKAAELRDQWSQPFCHRLQGETHGVLDTLFRHTFGWTQQQTLYLSPMVCSSYKKALVTHSPFHPSQLHVSHPALWCHSQHSPLQTSCSHPTFWDSDIIPK